MPPITHPDATVVLIKNLEESVLCSKGTSHNFCFNILNDTCFSVETKGVFFFKNCAEELAIQKIFQYIFFNNRLILKNF